MKVSMQITLDGLLRTLRWRAHTLAEDVALSRRPAGRDGARRQRPADDGASRMEDLRDDRARR